MLRAFSYLSVAAGVFCAFVLYAVNFETRRVQASAHKLSSDIEKTRRDIAVLKAERALLARPERIEPFARSLGLVPAVGGQFRVLARRSSSSSTSGPAGAEE